MTTPPDRAAVQAAVQAFINADTWDASRQIVAAQAALLLGAAAEAELDALLAHYQGDQQASHILTLHRHLLRRCREVGIEAAFEELEAAQSQAAEMAAALEQLTPEQQAQLQAMTALAQPLQAWLDTSTWEESGAYLTAHPELLVEETEEFLAQLETAASDQNATEAARNFALHCRLLQEARQVGVAAAYAQLRAAQGRADDGDRAGETPPDDLDPTQRAVLQLVNARDAEQHRRVLTGQADLLLTDEADQVLDRLIEQYRVNPAAERHLQMQRRVLRRCREVGIEAAFSEMTTDSNLGNADEVQSLVAELEQLTQMTDMPRRIDVCRRLLQLITRQTQPQGWAWLQNNLANSLAQSPRGDRVENLEEAIRHYTLALEVYTRRDFPVDWAGTENNLALAYSDRIRGDRAENLEEAIRHSTLALEVYSRRDFPVQWAATENNLANAYLNRIRGDRAENLEEAIRHYTLALEVYTRRDFPVDWAGTENNLALAYSNRIRGDRAESLEEAIRHYTLALEVYTRRDFPVQWATTENNLASAYLNRIRGDRAENLEEAIRHYTLALEVRTRRDFPVDWAMIEDNLATAYSDRIRGDRAENLEEAIRHYTLTLEVRTRRDFPVDWAMTENNLATAYSDRIRGDRTENLEEAIRHYTLALEVRTRRDFPVDWAMTENNLATAYSERIRGDRAENLEEAIRHYTLALEVYTRRDFPVDWAGTENNLANAYRNRIRGDRAENLEEAIRHYTLALEVYTRCDFPVQWATTENNLANAYSERIRGDRVENLEEAIRHYTLALEVYTRRDFPVDWAMTENNLASAYSDRIRGDRAENLEEAIRHYTLALTEYRADTWPERCRSVAYRLGRLLLDDLQRIEAARQALETAHQAVEALRAEATSSEARQALAEENAGMYARLVFCCLQAGDVVAAFQYAAAAKGRAFIDALSATRQDLAAAGVDDPRFLSAWQRAQAIRARLDALLTRLSGGALPGSDRRQLQQAIQQLRAEEAGAWQQIARDFPALSAAVNAPSLTADQALALARAAGLVLVEYYRHAGGWGAFVFTPTADQPAYVPLPGLDAAAFVAQAVTWLKSIESQRGRHTQHRRFLPALRAAALAPLLPHLPAGAPVVLAPFNWLHLMPLAAALETAGPSAPFTPAFMPSLGALHALRAQQAQRGGAAWRTPERLLTVAFPGYGRYRLPNVVPEAVGIGRWFATGQVTPLHEGAAQRQAVLQQARGQEAIHFGCHSVFDPAAPHESGFVLAGGWLTARQIATELHLDAAQLATLASCRSGYTNLEAGDNFSSLMQSVMTAGAPVVAASLWSVDDTATRLLFESFYGYVRAGAPPHQAMRQAVAKLRAQPELAHPYYWAAFRLTGLPQEAEAEPEPMAEAINALFVRAQPALAGLRRGAPMSRYEIVTGAEALLEDVAQSAADLATALPPGELAALAALLADLQPAADQMETEADLLALADAVHTLLEELPGVRAWLFEPTVDVAAQQTARGVTQDEFERQDEAAATRLANTPTLKNSIDWAAQSVQDQADQHETPPDPRLLAKVWRRLQAILGRAQG